MRTLLRRSLASALLAITVTIAIAIATTGCSAGEEGPSPGVYTVQFPSTAAAVGTDFVQILVFDATPENRAFLCQDLVRARIRGDALEPSVKPPAPSANICEMLAGRRPVPIPYGEKALLAIAQRKDRDGQLRDFLLGCAVMTIGEGDAPQPIPLRLVDVAQPVPDTQCGSVQEYCDDRCR